MEHLLHRGLPLSLSRWTDVAHWYKPWLRDLITRQGFVFAPDPEDGLLKMWSLDPEHVHTLFFWTKHPQALLTPMMTWLAPYRVYTAVTITGWDEAEPRAPDFETQLQGFRDLVSLVGPDKVCVRFSPVPTDLFVNPVRYTRWKTLCEEIRELGVRLDVSLLHDDHLNYDGVSRLEALDRLLEDAGDLQPGFCGLDSRLLEANGREFRRAECIDSSHLSEVFGLSNSSRRETQCDCLLSVDPCLGPKFGCGSGCTYCYAPYTKS